MTNTPSKLRRLWDDHSYGGKALSEEGLATIVAAADEIERLQRDNEELISYLKGISRQTHEMVNAHSTK